MILDTLVKLGIPGALILAVGWLVKTGWETRKAKKAAPDVALNADLARAQAAGQLSDDLIDNLRKDNTDLRRELAEQRSQRVEAERREHVALVERDDAEHKARALAQQLRALRAQMETQ